MAEPDPATQPAEGRSRMNRAAGVPTGTLRWLWASLTSMRTALALLLLLGLAAIPGSVLPQRPTSPFGVADYLAANPGWGPWLDRLGFFDVFGSAWFAAIYLLLFVSLVGCIIPRIAVYARALRAAPAPVPGRLTRFTARSGTVALPPGEVLDAAAAHLRRARVRREPGGLSAELGRSREAGNLVFHLSLVVLLLGLAAGSLWSFRGTAIVVEGQAFSNTLTHFDEFSHGAAFGPAQLTPFTLALDSFDVRFETGPTQRGAARLFRAQVSLTVDGGTRQEPLEVNAPLFVGGTAVHLLGHGYAPVVTVRDGNGDIAFAGPVVFLPQDSNFTSHGVIKAPDARPERLAFEGVFLPTAAVDATDGIVSVFPDAWNPQLLLNAWAGPPKQETGAPENVYVLDTAGLTQLTRADGEPLRAGLEPGTTFTLPDGRGSVSFDGLRRWTKLQVSSNPAGWVVLGSVLVAIAGLTVSLLVRPRRLFVAVAPAEGGTAVTVAGLDRVEGRPGLAEAISALAAACGLDAGVAGEEPAVTGSDPPGTEASEPEPSGPEPSDPEPPDPEPRQVQA
jgi:cytochrome c biogenesis protein